MKKYKLIRQSKKVFAAVLAVSLMMTSVAPGAVYASEMENTEAVAQTEEKVTETAAEQKAEPDTAGKEAQSAATAEADPETAKEETQPVETEPEASETPVVTEAGAETEEQPTETPTEQEPEETEQPAETETPAESETETTETVTSEVVKALQERINALPTVEEFQAMADGTTVENSNLSQKQTDVYNEAQAIADALDQLSEEEQGQVDTSKLEALFELMNGEIDLLAGAECEWGNTSDGTMTRTGTLDSALLTAYRTQGTYYIKLLKDVAMQGNSGNSWTIRSGREVHIDLNGHTLSSALSDVSASSVKTPFTVDKGTLVISDSSTEQTGVLDGTDHKRTIYVSSGGTFILEGGTITKSSPHTKYATSGDDLILLYGSAKFILDGGTISSGANASICVNMQKENSQFIMKKGKITGNTFDATVNAGVIDMWGSRTFVMEGGTISGNKTAGNGGVITVHDNNKIDLNGGEICNNEAAVGGGAIYFDGSSKNAVINLNGTTISGNHTNKDCGGAISSYSTSSTIYINSGEISKNHAKYHGGGIYTKGRLVMTAGTIKENEAEQEGGGVYLANTGTFVMAGGTIENNKSGKNWAGAISDYGTLMIGGNASVIKNTNASGQAANIYLNNDKAFTILNNGDVIDGNIPISGSWNGKAGVKTDQIKTENTHRQITTNGTTDDLQRITSDREEYQVGYEDDHLYLFKHTHEWSYSGNGNVVTAKCSVDTDPCEYHENELKLTVTAENMEYSGAAYDSERLIKIDNNITSVTNAVQSAIQYFAVDEDGKKTGNAISTPSAVGIYIADVNIGGATAEAKFEITKKTPEVTAPTALKLTYNGELQEIIRAGSATGGAKMQYKLDGDKTWSDTVPKAKDAGTHTIWYRVVGNEIYADMPESSIQVEILPKSITVKLKDASKVYGDKDGELSYSADGLAGEDTLSGITLTRAEGEDVGTYDITASEEEGANPNYSVKFDNKGTFNITQKEIGLSWADTRLTYNGKDQKPSVSATGLVGKDTCEITVTGAMKNTGTYTATATKLSNKNYKLPSEITTKYTIDAKEIGIEWSNLEFTYDGTKKQPTAKATGLVEGDTCGITVGGGVAEAGTHTAKAETADNANYKLPKEVETEFIINKAETVVSQKPEIISDLTYTGDAQNLISAGQTKDGKLVYKVNGGEWSETIPNGLDVGTYEISYKVVGDDNHKDSAEGQLTVTIAKKAVVVSGITAEDKTYDGNTRAVLNYDGVKFDGLLEKDSLSVTAEGTFENKNVGQKKVLVSNLTLDGASAKNYVLADDQQSETTATIKAKEITAVITPNGGTYEGTIIPATAVLNGLEGEDNPEITLTYTGIANDGTEADGTVPIHAGTYTVTASIADENYSLKAEGASAEFVVAKADPALSVSAVADKSYGEEPFKLETSNKGEGQKTYTSSDEKVITVDENGLVTIIGAGEATLTVSLAESTNYNAVTKTVTVTVLPKAVTVTPDSLKKVYDEADPELTYKVEGLVGEDTLTDITIVRAEGENAGTYDITAEAKEGSNPNYSITFEKGSFTITQKPIDTAEVTLGDALTYTGKEQIQNVEKVTLDGKEIPADAYTVENNMATEAGTYTLTIRAKENGNYIGALTWTYVIAPKQDGQSTENTDDSKQNGDGTDTKQTEKKSDTTGTSQTTVVETGDTTNVAGYGMALLVSVMVLVVSFLKRRKRMEK